GGRRILSLLIPALWLLFAGSHFNLAPSGWATARSVPPAKLRRVVCPNVARRFERERIPDYRYYFTMASSFRATGRHRRAAEPVGEQQSIRPEAERSAGG